MRARVLFEYEGVASNEIIHVDAYEEDWSIVHTWLHTEENSVQIPSSYIHVIDEQTFFQVVLYDFEAEEEEAMSVKEGQVVEVLGMEGEWSIVANDGIWGLLPSSYLSPQEETDPLALDDVLSVMQTLDVDLSITPRITLQLNEEALESALEAISPRSTHPTPRPFSRFEEGDSVSVYVSDGNMWCNGYVESVSNGLYWVSLVDFPGEELEVTEEELAPLSTAFSSTEEQFEIEEKKKVQSDRKEMKKERKQRKRDQQEEVESSKKEAKEQKRRERAQQKEEADQMRLQAQKKKEEDVHQQKEAKKQRKKAEKEEKEEQKRLKKEDLAKAKEEEAARQTILAEWQRELILAEAEFAREELSATRSLEALRSEKKKIEAETKRMDAKLFEEEKFARADGDSMRMERFQEQRRQLQDATKEQVLGIVQQEEAIRSALSQVALTVEQLKTKLARGPTQESSNASLHVPGDVSSNQGISNASEFVETDALERRDRSLSNGRPRRLSDGGPTSQFEDPTYELNIRSNAKKRLTTKVAPPPPRAAVQRAEAHSGIDPQLAFRSTTVSDKPKYGTKEYYEQKYGKNTPATDPTPPPAPAPRVPPPAPARVATRPGPPRPAKPKPTLPVRTKDVAKDGSGCTFECFLQDQRTVTLPTCPPRFDDLIHAVDACFDVLVKRVYCQDKNGQQKQIRSQRELDNIFQQGIRRLQLVS